LCLLLLLLLQVGGEDVPPSATVTAVAVTAFVISACVAAMPTGSGKEALTSAADDDAE
jgi:hypothetical protein